MNKIISLLTLLLFSSFSLLAQENTDSNAINYGLWEFLGLLGSLGIFIYGMKIMSEALQKSAGGSLRRILKGMTSNRFMAVFTGFFITAMVQSSSATTVMVVSFVNAGLLTLLESIGVIMGANIGTTITAWLVSVLGFKVKIVALALPMIGVAFPFLFSSNKKYRNFAEIIIGFGILFIGLDFLKHSVPDIKSNPGMMVFLEPYTHYGFGSVLLFLFIGVLLTVLVQSSSASTAITLVMVAEGWIGFEHAAAMFLGGNIGTTVTAVLAASIGNIHAKRAALFHFIFNIVGSIWVLLIFSWFIDFVDQLGLMLFGITVDPNVAGHAEKEDINFTLSLFHTVFNIVNVVVLIAFVPQLAKLVERLMPSKGGKDDQWRLKFINTGLMGTTELSIANAKNEIRYMARLVDKICVSYMALLFERPKNIEKVVAKIKKREDVTDQIEMEISKYLTRCAEGGISHSASKRIRCMLRMVNELERMADVFYQMTLSHERMKEEKTIMTEDAKSELKAMFDLIYKAVKLMRGYLAKPHGDVVIEEGYELEKAINEMRDKLHIMHYERIENKTYTLQEGLVFLDLVSSMEKVGDHIVNVNEAIVGEK